VLPEAAPAPKTDPVELSLLARYLAVVRQTQGEAAASQALAASGFTPEAEAVAAASATTARGAGQGDAHARPAGDAAAPAAVGGIEGGEAAADAGVGLAVPSLLGFIKQRKLAGAQQQQQQQQQQQHARRSSNGSSASAGSATGFSGGGVAGAGGVPLAQGRKVWIQPSGE
jgi:hypothetical protein